MERCQVTGCNRDAAVSFTTDHNLRIARCARHYMDDVDRAEKGSLSARVNAHLAIERENQRIIGGVEYRKRSVALARAFIAGIKP